MAEDKLHDFSTHQERSREFCPPTQPHPSPPPRFSYFNSKITLEKNYLDYIKHQHLWQFLNSIIILFICVLRLITSTTRQSVTWLSRITKESYQLWMRDVEILARSLTRWVKMIIILTCRYMKVLLCWHIVSNKLYSNLTHPSHQKLSTKSSEMLKCPHKPVECTDRNWRL